jgi:hypothetical protein
VLQQEKQAMASFLLKVEVQRHDTEVLHGRIDGNPATCS